MVDTIRELAAKLGNEVLFKWAIRNGFYIEEFFQDDLFIEVAENGHIKILELADTYGSMSIIQGH
jgi:hypothetical protein